MTDCILANSDTKKFFRQNFHKMFGKIVIFCFITLIDVKLVQNLPFEDYSVVQMPLIDWNRLKEDRSAAKSSTYLPFKIHGKDFQIALQQGQTMFTRDAVIAIHGENEPEIIKASEFQTEPVIGYIVNYPNSHVRGYIDDGIFNGIIQIGQNHFFVESADKYLKSTRSGEVIIYQNSVSDGQKRDTDDVYSFEADYSKQSGNYSQPYCKVDRHNYHPYDEYMDNPNHPDSGTIAEAANGNRVCNLKVVGDHTFLRELNHNDVSKAIKSMEFHVSETDQMYRSTDFDGNGRPDNIRVRVSRADVFRNPSDRGNPIGETNTNATYYLNQFTLLDHDKLCGAMAFSGRLFPEGTLGFAYRGGPKMSGGICYPKKMVKGKSKSLNVGMVTFFGTSGRVPIQQSSVLVAHELGHMFGSPHDESMENGRCFSPNTAKHFIMSSVSNPGTSETNRRFSSCSIKMIQANLKVNGQCLACRGRDCGGGRSGGLNAMKISFSHTIVSIFIIGVVMLLETNI